MKLSRECHILGLNDFRSEFSETDLERANSIFHEFSYLERLELALGSPVQIFLSKSSLGASTIAMALFSRENYKGLSLAPFTPFNPIWESGSSQENLNVGLTNIFEKLAQVSGRHHCHYAPNRNTCVDPAGPWVQEEFFTYQIDLRSGEWSKKYSNSLSRIIKKGQDAVEFRLDNSQSSKVCDFVAASYKRNNRNLPLNLDAMKELAQSMIDDGLADVYLATDKKTSEIKAGVICLGKTERSYYWMAGGERGVWMTVLIDRLLQRLSQNSISTFDFLGANNPSIAEFKRRFGGDIVSYKGFRSNIGAEAKIRATISGIINK